jgi:beta-glucanase (GH16 family)
VLLLVVTAVVLAAAITAWSRAQTTARRNVGQAPVFSDDFNGTGVDWTRWRDTSSAEADRGHGNKENQQLEWNQAANCSTANGILTITAKPDDITSPSGTHYDWSSCLISSDFAFQYGYIEARMKFPSPAGFWPAFWTWQAPGARTWVETDVVEAYSHERRRVYLTQRSGLGGGCTLKHLGFDPTQRFHVYGAAISRTGVRFYIDGHRVCSAPGTPDGPTNIALSTFVYSLNPPAPGTRATTQIDYVRAWTK